MAGRNDVWMEMVIANSFLNHLFTIAGFKNKEAYLSRQPIGTDIDHLSQPSAGKSMGTSRWFRQLRHVSNLRSGLEMAYQTIGSGSNYPKLRLRNHSTANQGPPTLA